MKKVTVLMSAYNHEKYIERSIESVLNQTFQDFYFKIADDCSTDGTAKKIIKYENKIDEIHLYDSNSGCGRISDMLNETFTPYVAMIHSDDFWEATKLEKQVAYLESRPECAACFTWVKLIDDTGNEIKDRGFCQKNRKKEEWIRFFWSTSNCLAHPSIVIRTDLYKELTQYENLTVYRQLPDYYMWIKLLQKHNIYILPEKLVTFRIHGSENMSAPTLKNTLRDNIEQSFIWYELMKKIDDSFFKKAFGDIWFNKNANTKEEITCEKFLMLASSPVSGIAQAATWYYMDAMKNKKVYNVLKEEYGFDSKQFYELEFERGYMKEVLKNLNLRS